MQPNNHIYTWYEGNYHAIKVGMSKFSTPEDRMNDYADTYSFKSSKLHKIAVPQALSIRDIEETCHQLLLARGLVRIPPTKELFALGKTMEYETAVELVEDEIKQVVSQTVQELLDNPAVNASYRELQQQEAYRQQTERYRLAQAEETERARLVQVEQQEKRQRDHAAYNAKFQNEQKVWRHFLHIREQALLIAGMMVPTMGMQRLLAPTRLLARHWDKKAMIDFGTTYQVVRERWKEMDPAMRKQLKLWYRGKLSADDFQSLFRKLTNRA